MKAVSVDGEVTVEVPGAMPMQVRIEVEFEYDPDADIIQRLRVLDLLEFIVWFDAEHGTTLEISEGESIVKSMRAITRWLTAAMNRDGRFRNYLHAKARDAIAEAEG